MITVSALFFDGVSPGSEEIVLDIIKGCIRFKRNDQSYSYGSKDYSTTAPYAGEPLILELKTGERIEIPAEFQKGNLLKFLLPSSSVLVFLIENKKKYFLSAIVIVILLFVLFVKKGAPAISYQLASIFPQKWANKLDPIFLKSIDEYYLKATELSSERQAELTSFFNQYAEMEVKILFRKGGPLEANAFALSGETIIFTDELVNHLQKKELLLPIFLHELGHLKHRHLLARFISVGLVNAVAFFVIGDTEGITESLANLGMTLISLKHSRDLETESDLYSAQHLNKNGVSFECFENAFLLMKSYYVKKGALEEEGVLSNMENYLSTHPDIKTRVNRVKNIFSKREVELLDCSMPN